MGTPEPPTATGMLDEPEKIVGVVSIAVESKINAYMIHQLVDERTRLRERIAGFAAAREAAPVVVCRQTVKGDLYLATVMTAHDCTCILGPTRPVRKNGCLRPDPELGGGL